LETDLNYEMTGEMEMNNRRLLFIALLIAVLIWTAGCVESDGQGLSSDVKISAPADARVLDAASSYQPLAAGWGIVVTGEGKMRVTPDQAVLTVGVVTTGESSQEVMAENSAAMNRVISTLKREGVDEKDIKTQSVNVWPEFDYGREGEQRELPTILGYRAENRVSVTIRDIGKTGEVIDSAVASGANQLYGLSFTMSEEASKNLRTQVLREAVFDATDKAQVIADAIGAEKIIPVSVVEGGGYTPPIYRYDVAALEKGAASTPISPGETEVSASVTVTFDFE
jgi:uncharacterized protein YggE